MATTTPPFASRERRIARKERTHDRLVDSAVRLFAARGYDATSVDAIAEETGVARQTFFNYFPTKDHVVTAWVDQRRDAVLDGLRSVAHGDALARLERGLHAVAALYDSDAALSRPMVRTWVRCGGPVGAGADTTADLLEEVIRSGQAAGQVRNELARPRRRAPPARHLPRRAISVGRPAPRQAADHPPSTTRHRRPRPPPCFVGRSVSGRSCESVHGPALPGTPLVVSPPQEFMEQYRTAFARGDLSVLVACFAIPLQVVSVINGGRRDRLRRSRSGRAFLKGCSAPTSGWASGTVPRWRSR